MTQRHALIAGATGLVGGHLLPRLLASGIFGRVTALVRRRPPVDHPGLTVRMADFAQLGDLADLGVTGITDVFCALGTTIAAAGSEDAFRSVDHGHVVSLAKAALRAGASRFLLVSSVGADPGSRTFYLRVKGATERDVAACGFARVDIFRPGLLLGARTERRLGEALAQGVLPRVDWLLRGALSRYRSVDADVVARAMVGAARGDAPGRYVHEYREIVRLAVDG